MESFIHRLGQLIHGKELADKYCTSDSSIFYMVVNRHLGDAVRNFKALKAIKLYYGIGAEKYHFVKEDDYSNAIKKKKCIKKLVILTTQSIYGIARLYSQYLDDIIVMKREELDDLELYAISGCGEHHNIFCDTNLEIRIKRNWETDEGEYVRTKMFGFGDLNWDICLPRDMKNCFGNMKIDEQTKRETQKIISELKLNDKTTIIFCPRAQSSGMLELEIWNRFSKFLQNKGFQIFTNVHGEEKAIEGTIPLEIKVDILACLANLGYRIIGVQSGLMDVLVEAKPEKLTVLSVIKKAYDSQCANYRGAVNEVNVVNNVTYLRIEHFEEEYVLKLLEENFH